jgi:hypothetical protein
MLAPLFGHGHGDDAIWAGRNANISSTLHQLLQASPETWAIRTNWCELSDAAVRTVRQVYSSALLVVAAIAFFRARGQRGAIAMQASVVTIMVSLFAPLTRSYHCALLALAGMWFVAAPCKGVGRRVAWTVIATAFAVSMQLRQKSILGRDLWRALDHCGLVHFGIVGMLVLLACTPTVPAVGDPHSRDGVDAR